MGSPTPFVANHSDLIASYFARSCRRTLAFSVALSGPIEEAQISIINPLSPRNPRQAGLRNSSCSPRFLGTQEEVMVRAVWAGSPFQLLMPRSDPGTQDAGLLPKRCLWKLRDRRGSEVR